MVVGTSHSKTGAETTEGRTGAASPIAASLWRSSAPWLIDAFRPVRTLLRLLTPTRRAVLLGAAVALSAATAARAEIYTLHIGIDKYRYVPALDGAVADAVAFEKMFSSTGAETTLLLDEEVTRERIISEFNEMADKAKPGDTIVLTYAGHGAQMRERTVGDEEDQLDEFFVMPLFGRDQFSPWNDMLIDNDVAKLFKAVDPAVTIVFIADSCHSGTMTRSLDPRGAIGKSRKITPSTRTLELLNDEDRPDPSTIGVNAEQLPNVIFVAAALEHELANETRETGAPRGALSVAVEEAMVSRGAGIGTIGELEQLRAHVLNRVRSMFGNRQNPDVSYNEEYVLSVLEQRGLALASAAPLTRGLDRIPGGSVDAARENATEYTPPDLAESLVGAFIEATPKIFVDGDASAVAGDIARFGEIVDERGAADIAWDLAANEMVDVATADMIGAVVDASAAEKVVAKWRAVEAITDATASRSLNVSIAPEDDRLPTDTRFREGDLVNIEIEWPLKNQDPYPYVTIVNLANAGEVQYIFPYNLNPQVLGPEKTTERVGAFPVKAPFGADHVVVLASKQPMTGFWLELDKLHETPAVQDFLALLDRFASGDDVRIGVTGLYTEE